MQEGTPGASRRRSRGTQARDSQMNVEGSLKEKDAPVVAASCWEAQLSFQVSGVCCRQLVAASPLDERACSGSASVHANVSTVLV